MKQVLYRPGSKEPLGIAFAIAVAIHVSVFAFAPVREPAVVGPDGGFQDVDIVAAGPEDPVPESPPIAETPVQSPLETPNEFTDEPEPAPPQLPKPTKPIRGTRVTPPQNATGNGKLFAINSPRPAYPYEARRLHLTGSGVALLDVDRPSGSVLAARIIQSTGSPILDSSALSAFRRWRFRPGSPSHVRIPFTFTMYGAQL